MNLVTPCEWFPEKGTPHSGDHTAQRLTQHICVHPQALLQCRNTAVLPQQEAGTLGAAASFSHVSNKTWTLEFFSQLQHLHSSQEINVVWDCTGSVLPGGELSTFSPLCLPYFCERWEHNMYNASWMCQVSLKLAHVFRSCKGWVE